MQIYYYFLNLQIKFRFFLRICKKQWRLLGVLSSRHWLVYFSLTTRDFALILCEDYHHL